MTVQRNYNRQGPGYRFTDFTIGVSQAFEPGARKSARIAGANAAVAQGASGVEDTTRSVLRLASAGYYRALHASERIRLLDAAAELAARVHWVADRRFRAGDIAVLEVNIARATLARVRAAREAAAASRALALGDLRQLLSLEGEIDVAGVLERPGDADLGAVLQSASQRPELRALEAAVQAAEAATLVSAPRLRQSTTGSGPGTLARRATRSSLAVGKTERRL